MCNRQAPVATTPPLALLFLVILSRAISRDKGYVTSPACHPEGCWHRPSGTVFRLIAIPIYVSIYYIYIYIHTYAYMHAHGVWLRKRWRFNWFQAEAPTCLPSRPEASQPSQLARVAVWQSVLPRKNVPERWSSADVTRRRYNLDLGMCQCRVYCSKPSGKQKSNALWPCMAADAGEPRRTS